MAYDEGVAERLRECLRTKGESVEKRMFGGVAFMVDGHMCIGVNDHDLMVRVGPDAAETALARKGARPMDFTGRPMKGFVWVGPEGFAEDDELDGWVELGLQFVRTLPPK